MTALTMMIMMSMMMMRRMLVIVIVGLIAKLIRIKRRLSKSTLSFLSLLPYFVRIGFLLGQARFLFDRSDCLN